LKQLESKGGLGLIAAWTGAYKMGMEALGGGNAEITGSSPCLAYVNLY